MAYMLDELPCVAGALFQWHGVVEWVEDTRRYPTLLQHLLVHPVGVSNGPSQIGVLARLVDVKKQYHGLLKQANEPLHVYR